MLNQVCELNRYGYGKGLVGVFDDSMLDFGIDKTNIQ
jgi:hypothetical protein